MAAWGLASACPAATDWYRLDAGTTIAAGAAALDAGSHAAPTVADWNADGRKDLILGWFGSTVKVYLNQGTDAAPAFGTFSTVSGISVPYG